jgi:hypothetical protein
MITLCMLHDRLGRHDRGIAVINQIGSCRNTTTQAVYSIYRVLNGWYHQMDICVYLEGEKTSLFVAWLVREQTVRS